MRCSFAVHAYDEGPALRRLVESSLPMADLIAEWVILDHRSADDTPAVCAELRPLLALHGIGLEVVREARDLSAAFTFADLRTATLRACAGDVIALHDADFILGPRYRHLLERALEAFAAPRSRLHGASYAVPVVWDRLATDAAGTVTDHGRVWVHSRRPRILRRCAVRYEQTKDRGRWERLVVDPRWPKQLELSPRREGPASAVLSANVKPPERIALRDTMTMFMQDAVQRKVSGGWLENYGAGRSRSQWAYDYVPGVDLRGWTLHAPNLELVA